MSAVPPVDEISTVRDGEIELSAMSPQTASVSLSSARNRSPDIERGDAEAQISKEKPDSYDWIPKGLVDGFPRTAAFIKKDPDQTATVFRRFDELSMRNLLILQGRVAALEAVQKTLDKMNYEKAYIHQRKSYGVMSSALSYEDFATCGPPKDNSIPSEVWKKWRERREAEGRSLEEKIEGRIDGKLDESWDGENFKLTQAIKVALKEYHEAILLHSQILKLERPARRTREVVRDWFNGDGPRAVAPQAKYSGRDLFKDEGDLLSLHPPADEDVVSRFTARHLGWLLKDREKSDGKVNYTPETRINKFSTGFVGFIAISFLIGAIWSLWHTIELEKKLGTVTGFIVGFGLFISNLTRATRLEVFGATAAYAATLIIYVARPPTG